RGPPQGELDLRLRRALLELEPCQQPIFSPGNLPSLAQIGNLELGLLEHFLASKARGWPDAGECGGVAAIGLGRLARAGGKGDDHSVDFALRHEARDRVLDALSECDVAASINHDEARLRWHSLKCLGDLGETHTQNRELSGKGNLSSDWYEIVLAPLRPIRCTVP